MIAREYNLLDEPWIIAMCNDGSTEKVSLIDALARAPEFRALAGELPTQDMAVLRLLLAVLHAAASRYDPDGTESPLESSSGAIKRWKKVWNAKHFPMDTIREYLEQYRHRFWLFDPEIPFFQVPDMEYGTKYGAAKLNGELSESNNKLRLFPQYSGKAKTALSYDEAARWLICTLAYDDAGSKKQGPDKDKLGPMGPGWLGRFSTVCANGRNLFETLMLNLVLVPNNSGVSVGEAEEYPEWEHEDLRRGQRVPFPVPLNLGQLYTVQSRRMQLFRSDVAVSVYILYGGDELSSTNAFIEQMACWKNIAKKNEAPQYIPRRFNPTNQLWREFSSLAAETEGQIKPGIVSWLASLKLENAIERGYMVRLTTVTVFYGSMSSSVDNVYKDDIAFSANMLCEKGAEWVSTVIGQIEVSKALADRLANLAQCIAKAAGDSDSAAKRDAAREKAFFGLDMPFREWLEGIDAEGDDQGSVADEWWSTARTIVRSIGRGLIAAAGTQALVGRTISENNTQKFYCAPDAYERFLYYTSSREALRTGGKKNG